MILTNFFQAGQCKPFQDALNKSMIADSKSKNEVQQMVLEVELMMRESMYGFHENKKASFLKVNTCLKLRSSSSC